MLLDFQRSMGYNGDKEVLMSIEIKITSKRYDCDITLRERVTVIVGDSGVGKTCFAKALLNRGQVYTISLSAPEYDCCILTPETWESVLKVDILDCKKRIYVIDDADYMFTEAFAKLYVQIKQCYFIFITRLEVSKEVYRWSMLPFSGKEVYEFRAVGRHHYLRPYYNYVKLTESTGLSTNTVDVCLCEDKKSGYEFAQRLFKCTDSAESKDKLLMYLYNHVYELKGKNVFLWIDFSAIGFIMEECIAFAAYNGFKILYCSEIHSFEYVLLVSNLFRIEDDIIFNCYKICQKKGIRYEMDFA